MQFPPGISPDYIGGARHKWTRPPKSAREGAATLFRATQCDALPTRPCRLLHCRAAGMPDRSGASLPVLFDEPGTVLRHLPDPMKQRMWLPGRDATPACGRSVTMSLRLPCGTTASVLAAGQRRGDRAEVGARVFAHDDAGAFGQFARPVAPCAAVPSACAGSLLTRGAIEAGSTDCTGSARSFAAQPGRKDGYLRISVSVCRVPSPAFRAVPAAAPAAVGRVRARCAPCRHRCRRCCRPG